MPCSIHALQETCKSFLYYSQSNPHAHSSTNRRRDPLRVRGIQFLALACGAFGVVGVRFSGGEFCGAELERHPRSAQSHCVAAGGADVDVFLAGRDIEHRWRRVLRIKARLHELVIVLHSGLDGLLAPRHSLVPDRRKRIMHRAPSLARARTETRFVPAMTGASLALCLPPFVRAHAGNLTSSLGA